MKILAINGSPRGKASNTHKMITEILTGAGGIGAEVEIVNLSKLKVLHCLGCFGCWMDKDNKCVINDDMDELLKKYTQSDIVIYGTPVLMDGISSLLKTFIDRCLPIISPHSVKNEEGEYLHGKSEKYNIPKFVIVSNSGFPEQSKFLLISSYFKQLAKSMHTEVIAEVYRGLGMALLKLPKNAKDRPIVDRYNQLLNLIGAELAMNKKLSTETELELLKELVSHDEYMEKINNYWKKALISD